MGFSDKIEDLFLDESEEIIVFRKMSYKTPLRLRSRGRPRPRR